MQQSENQFWWARLWRGYQLAPDKPTLSEDLRVCVCHFVTRVPRGRVASSFLLDVLPPRVALADSKPPLAMACSGTGGATASADGTRSPARIRPALSCPVGWRVRSDLRPGLIAALRLLAGDAVLGSADPVPGTRVRDPQDERTAMLDALFGELDQMRQRTVGASSSHAAARVGSPRSLRALGPSILRSALQRARETGTGADASVARAHRGRRAHVAGLYETGACGEQANL